MQCTRLCWLVRSIEACAVSRDVQILKKQRLRHLPYPSISCRLVNRDLNRIVHFLIPFPLLLLPFQWEAMWLINFISVVLVLAAAVCASPLNTGLQPVGATSTTCSLVVPTNLPKSLNCGVFGSLKASKIEVVQLLQAANLTACAQSCTINGACVSFGYSSSHQCQLYGKPLNDMGLKTTSSGQTIMYNRK